MTHTLLYQEITREENIFQGADRDSDHTHSKIGLLKTIQYFTGGHTIFPRFLIRVE